MCRTPFEAGTKGERRGTQSGTRAEIPRKKACKRLQKDTAHLGSSFKAPCASSGRYLGTSFGNKAKAGYGERECAKYSSLTLVSPARSVDDEASQDSGEGGGDGQGDDPAHVDPGNHAPVDGAPGAGAQADTDGGAGDALGGRHGKFCGCSKTGKQRDAYTRTMCMDGTYSNG